LVGDRKVIRPVKTGCWFVDGDGLTGALHDLQLQLSPLSSSLSLIKPANPGSPRKMAVKMEREEQFCVETGFHAVPFS